MEAQEKLAKSKEMWVFFLRSHSDTDVEAFIDHIVEEVRKSTLSDIAKYLKEHSDWVIDEEGIVCSQCGKDIYHCECKKQEGVEDELPGL